MNCSRPRPLFGLLAVAALIMSGALFGCGAEKLAPMQGDGPPPPPTSIDLTVVNRSLFELSEIRLHRTPEYRSSTNRLGQPLADDAEVTFVGIANNQYVTVIRRRIEAGKRIAFTTAWALKMTTNRQKLYVFQESFRLESHANVFPAEAGPMDGGDDDGGDSSDDDGGDSITPGDP